MSLRTEYTPLLLEKGFTQDEIEDMSNQDFETAINRILDDCDDDLQRAIHASLEDSAHQSSSSQYSFCKNRQPVLSNSRNCIFEKAYTPKFGSHYTHERHDASIPQNITNPSMNYSDEKEENDNNNLHSNKSSQETYYYKEHMNTPNTSTSKPVYQDSIGKSDLQNSMSSSKSKSVQIDSSNNNTIIENKSENDISSQHTFTDQSNNSDTSYSHVYKHDFGCQPTSEHVQTVYDQDAEYREALEKETLRQIEEDAAEHFEQNEAQIQEERLAEVVGQYYSLPKEPEKGTTIAVLLNGKRIMRKFDPNEKGQHVYVWVAGQTMHDDDNDDKLYLDNFNLVIPPFGNELKHDQTLKEQGLTSRHMLQIDMI